MNLRIKLILCLNVIIRRKRLVLDLVLIHAGLTRWDNLVSSSDPYLRIWIRAILSYLVLDVVDHLVLIHSI